MIGDVRRPSPLLAVIALAAGLLAGAGDAVGKDHQEGHREEGHHEEGRREQGPARGDAGRGAPGRQGPGQAYRGEDYRGGGYGDPRLDPRMDPRNGYRADPRYDPRAYGAPPSYGGSARRGGYLGPSAGGEVIQDPGRFRLRAPPRGYEWVRTSRGMALVSRSTGQVFDVVPY